MNEHNCTGLQPSQSLTGRTLVERKGRRRWTLVAPKTSSASATYILPIRRDEFSGSDDLPTYLRWLATRMEVVVVDGSPAAVFSEHERRWGASIMHIPPNPSLAGANGKVRGVLTGVQIAGHERLIVADDDVRYGDTAIARMLELLDTFEVVRPQNYFAPLTWHARWDTSRTLLNRMTGGDWPGTLGVRRSALQATKGYDSDVLFENLELVRTVEAAGGRQATPLDLYVRRKPPATSHFWSQRIRQAYDEFSRPARLAVFLCLLPAVMALAIGRRFRVLTAGVVAVMAVAEAGRRRAGGAAFFPVSATLLAPVWLGERAICSWLAVGVRVAFGGVRYRGLVLRWAATPTAILHRRHAGAIVRRPCGPERASTQEAARSC